MNPTTEDKIEPYLEPLMVPLVFWALFWLFVTFLLVLGPSFVQIVWLRQIVSFLYGFLTVAPLLSSVLVLIYEILLWLKMVKPRALIKSVNPVFLKLRWAMVVIALFVIVPALIQSFGLASNTVDYWLHPPIETAG
ncbi:MAG: hypothetical protein WCW31_01380 [Patescibacteria group bacterium]|jgi:hypothetical protein